jgi:alpha-L-rhamnosidase
MCLPVFHMLQTMKILTRMTLGAIWASLSIALASLTSGAGEPSIAAVEKQFRELPMEARRLTGPLFWMHGTETRAQLEGELQKVLEGGNGIFTAEPRPHKDWLGEGWYQDLAICLEFAKKNDLKMIIYDDWWWPSQMMGGRVPPQYGSKRLEAASVTLEGPKALNEASYGDSNLVAVVAGRVVEGDALDGKSLVTLTASIENGTLKWAVPAGKWSIMKFTWRFNGTKGGQKKYISVDGASPDCVAWFIKAVYQPHYDRFGKDFGKTIVGYFYDEPETQGDWGSDVPVLIAERKQDLSKLLVGYKFKLAGEEQTAAFQTYLNSFADSWGRTMYGGMAKWCKAHNVFSMGHFMEHGSCMFSRTMSAGNMMQLQSHSDMGGIDLVCRQLYPGNRPMGSYQMPKIASSLSHTYNKANDIAFCEIFGGYSQTLTYPQMKWLADWHQVRGVNLLIPHSFNPRAPFDKDYPPYFYNGGFEPRWPLYRVWADYSSRLSTMLTVSFRQQCMRLNAAT